MSVVYWTGVLTGGVLVLLSAMSLGDADAELDVEAELDVDVDADVDADGPGLSDWLPLTSLRFWTFVAAFGGLAGVLGEATGVGAVPTAIIAALTGLTSGSVMSRVMRRLKHAQIDSTVRADDYVGGEARVLLAVGPGGAGKVRATIRGRDIDLLARTRGETSLPAGARVRIRDLDGDGTAWVMAD